MLIQRESTARVQEDKKRSRKGGRWLAISIHCHATMSLSLSFKPLPTLHACYSVPIEWSVTGNATAAQQGQVKLVFVSAQSSVSRV